MRKSHTKRVVIGAAALSLLFAGSAFTASNSVDNSIAGTGSQTISGVTTTGVSYTLSTDKTQINTVTFEDVAATDGATLAADDSASIAFGATPTDTDWTECTISIGIDTAADTIECTGLTQELAAASDLNLVVTS